MQTGHIDIFGIDNNGPIPFDDDDKHVMVPSIVTGPTPLQQQEINELINATQSVDDIDLYESVFDLINIYFYNAPVKALQITLIRRFKVLSQLCYQESKGRTI